MVEGEKRFDIGPEVKGARRSRLPENPEPRDKLGVVDSGRFPSWLHRRLPKGGGLWETEAVLGVERLSTVCEEARCPNLFECWSRKTATFLAMGSSCTRSCGFCSIDFTKAPAPLEVDEPKRLADSVKALGLKHVVITMVARDDLSDGGAAHLAQIMRAVKEESPAATIEVLTSDFAGDTAALDLVLDERPTVFNHNIETVRSLTPRVRHRATYDRSLALLTHAAKRRTMRLIKSGLMVGLGEQVEEVQETLVDLQRAGVEIVTMGQYLQPTSRNLTVKEFITPEQYEEYAEYGRSIGIKHMYCGPFVRSSYNADLFAEEIVQIG